MLRSASAASAHHALHMRVSAENEDKAALHLRASKAAVVAVEESAPRLRA